MQYSLQLFHDNPQPGRWKFVLLQNFTSSGNQSPLGFSARIGFNNAQVTASGLPTSPNTLLSASGKPVTATIGVTNMGAITQAYFADARLANPGVIALPGGLCAASATLPGTGDCYHVPPEVSTLAFIAASTAPIQMDAFNEVGYTVGGTGNPDIFAKTIAPNTVLASLTEPEVPYGLWVVAPALIGPYGPAGAPGTITITPDASQIGKTVSGYVYVDTINPTVGTGDEVVRIPYSYTVAP